MSNQMEQIEFLVDEVESELQGKRGKKKGPSKKEAREASLKEVKARFGIEGPMFYSTAQLPVAKLVVEGAGQDQDLEIRGAKALAKNIEVVGMLHPPSVVPVISTSGTQGTYLVIAGRRRVLAARIAGLDNLECHVYPEWTTKNQICFVTLSENLSRGPNWALEVRNVADLLRASQPTTEKELAGLLGKSVATIRTYSRLAQLPARLLEEMVEGRLSKVLAEQIVRLPKARQQELAEGLELEDDKGRTDQEEGDREDERDRGQITREQVSKLRYAQASESLNQLKAQFEELEELEDFEEFETQEQAGIREIEEAEIKLEKFKQMLKELKAFAEVCWPGRTANQVALYTKALLTELPEV